MKKLKLPFPIDLALKPPTNRNFYLLVSVNAIQLFSRLEHTLLKSCSRHYNCYIKRIFISVLILPVASVGSI